MSIEDEKRKLGISYWHSAGAVAGDRSSVYCDVHPTRDRDIPSNMEVLLVGQDRGGSMSFVDMSADDAEMLGMRLIAAARMYREQAGKETDDE